MIELRPLRQFIAVAEELHFGRAAERLHISQPALTQAIQQLELRLGAPLLERSQRRVALSPAGAALLPELRRLIAAADAAMYAAKLRMKEGGDFTTAVEAIAPAAEATRPSVLIPVLAARMFAPPAPGLRTHRDARRAFTRARWRPLPGHDPPPPPQRAPGWSDHASGGRFSDRRGPRTRGGFAEGIIGSLPLTRLS